MTVSPTLSELPAQPVHPVGGALERCPACGCRLLFGYGAEQSCVACEATRFRLDAVLPLRFDRWALTHFSPPGAARRVSPPHASNPAALGQGD